MAPIAPVSHIVPAAWEWSCKSQLAVLRACQIPFRSGCPSKERGARYAWFCPQAAAMPAAKRMTIFKKIRMETLRGIPAKILHDASFVSQVAAGKHGKQSVISNSSLDPPRRPRRDGSATLRIMPDCQGKTIIVTGSTGIAAAAVRLATAAGARVLVATSDERSGWDLAEETGADCWAGDLAAPSSADSILAHCVGKLGRVDALFNAAGLSGRRFGDGPVDQCTDEGWDLALTHNLTTTFLLCRAAVGQMLLQEPGDDGMRGAILNTGSAFSDSPEPRHFALHAYSAAKGGVVALSKSMAAYYAPHKIRVNVIAPGLARTPLSERSESDPELAQFLKTKQPLTGGMMDAAEVARAALFLLSEGARAITGEVLRVDAGWSLSGV